MSDITDTVYLSMGVGMVCASISSLTAIDDSDGVREVIGEDEYAEVLKAIDILGEITARLTSKVVAANG